MPRTDTIIFILGTIVLTASAEVRAQDSNHAARCAELEDASARLACYDEVVGRTNAPPPDEPKPLSQDVGAEQLEGKHKPDSEPEIVHGRVTECRKDSSNKLYFVFDNGQVWKQRSDSSLRLRDCDFAATITKDGLGYKMRIDGEGKKIRIGRVR